LLCKKEAKKAKKKQKKALRSGGHSPGSPPRCSTLLYFAEQKGSIKTKRKFKQKNVFSKGSLAFFFFFIQKKEFINLILAFRKQIYIYINIPFGFTFLKILFLRFQVL
jgi:hypothetical protein